MKRRRKATSDVTPWLEWFLGCLDRAFDGADRTLAAVFQKAEFWKKHAGATINERQRDILNRLLDGFEGKLTSTKWALIEKCSPDTALRDINELVGAWHSSEGRGGRAEYQLLASRWGNYELNDLWITLMGNIRSIDMMFLDDIFEMGSGYVLNFSDRTFAQFFAEELNIDIDEPKYAQQGSSKAKRLRFFLQTVEKPAVVRTLNALWEYREAVRLKFAHEDKVQNAHGRLLALVERLSGGEGASSRSQAKPAPAFERAVFAELQDALISLGKLDPQPRGYAFEAFLKSAFTKFGLEAHEPFRIRGEQIDGSFVLGNETYLLEAKWQNGPCGADHLHTFHGKISRRPLGRVGCS